MIKSRPKRHPLSFCRKQNFGQVVITVLVRVWVLFFYRLKKIKKCSFCVSQFWTPPLARLLFIFFEYGVVILDISLIF